MAFSDNMASLEPWAVPSVLSGTWLSDAFARDTDALTKALQQSLTRHQPETATVFHSSYAPVARPESVPGSSSEPETAPKRVRNPIPVEKIGKRKSRATKRSPTTYITADPANFRAMVQQVTGAGFRGGSHVAVGNGHVVKPEPQRAVTREQRGLPMLDTSAFMVGQDVVVGPSDDKGSSGFDGVGFRIFPTLESWHAM